jgi:hypothetical protein
MLQWTITHANMHRAAERKAEMWRNSDNKHAADFANLYEGIALPTKENGDHEAKRRTSIVANRDMTRLKRRRVILLGNGERSGKS